MTATLQRVCVYCATNVGAKPAYIEAARELGALLAARDCALVYGGGGVGLMGALADAVLAGGGEVIGVMPHALVEREAAHRGLTALHVVDTMHERKAMMTDLADAFVAMPGGLGTLEEFFETWTWAQLGVHRKPVGLLNVSAYWHPLVMMMEHAAAEGFLRGAPQDWLVIESEPASMLDRLSTFQPPVVRRWLQRGES